MNDEHLKMIEDVTKELQESAEHRGFLNGQKAEREKIRLEAFRIWNYPCNCLRQQKLCEHKWSPAFHSLINFLTENNQHETN